METKENRLRLSKPGADEHVAILHEPGRDYQFEFNLSHEEPVFSRKDTDLVLHWKNGGTLTLGEFFTDFMPSVFVLSDGSEVRTADFLDAMGQTLTID